MEPPSLLILEDELDELDTYTAEADELEIITFPFTSGLAALRYLHTRFKQNGTLPDGYLVDMKILGSPQELASSERIHQFVAQHASTEFFRFHTGNYCEHDDQVAQRTGAEVILKEYYGHRMEFLREVACVPTR